MTLHLAPLVFALLGSPAPVAPVAVSAEATVPSDQDIEEIAEAFANRLDDALDLTDEQSAEVRRILLHHVEQMKPHIEYIRAQPSRFAQRRAAAKRRSELKKIRAQTEAALRAVLDDAQWDQFEALSKDFRDELKARMKG